MVSPDDRSPEVEIFHLTQGGLGLPDREYYTGSDPKLVIAREAYLALRDQASRLGRRSRTRAPGGGRAGVRGPSRGAALEPLRLARRRQGLQSLVHL